MQARSRPISSYAHRYNPTSVPCEEQEHTSLSAAWESFRLFAEPNNADVYSQIELVEYSYPEDTERLVARIEFRY